MNKRPTKEDSEREILRMQREYLSEKRKNKELQPAAKVVRLNKDGNEATEDTRSAFARSRNISKPKANERKEAIIIGDIVERTNSFTDDSFSNFDDNTASDAFPKPIKLNLSTIKTDVSGSSERTSLFGKTLGSKRTSNVKLLSKSNITEKSFIIEGTEAKTIHEENVKKLEGMSEEEILKERAELLRNIDPSLVEFLKSRRVVNMTDDQKSQEIEGNLKMEVDPVVEYEIPVVDLLTNHQDSKNWLHFDVLEPEKLEWTKNVEDNIKSLKPGESFEARFDWKGVLLPYKDLSESVKDDRELYLHGDEAHRPGYTLQELFRLARANVLQQRVSALNAISGILNIYNQGFYDGILDLPISKIFFFLRFALDENTPAIVETASRALAYLFYNDTDEVLLDTIYEAGTGMHQPAMEKSAMRNQSDPLEDAFSDMSLENDGINTNKPFASTIDDEDFDKEKETMNDFHLAETDLVECLLRTNILERIRYILMTIQPEPTTTNTCLKILIRIARTNNEMAIKIINTESLMKGLIENHLYRIENVIDDKKSLEPLVIKLFRILASYDTSICVHLKDLNVLEIIKGYIFTRKDINTRLIQMQIEIFRFIRLYLTLIPDEQLYTDILPALRYMLDWHYQNLVFEEHGPFIIKQHAAAMLNLLLCGDMSLCYPVFVDIFEIILCKWFNSASRNGLQEFSQKILLASCLNVCSEFMSREPRPFMTFVDNYLRLFLESSTFESLTKEMSSRSSLLSSQKDRSNICSALSNLGSIIIRNKQSAPTLIFSKNYSAFLLHSLLNFCNKLSSLLDTNAKQQQLHKLLFNDHIKNFIDNFLLVVQHEQCTNWFVKIEIMLLLSIVNATKLNQHIFNQKTILGLALQLLTYLTQEMTTVIITLLDEVIFNHDYYGDGNVSKEQLNAWRNIYVDTIISSLKIKKLCGKSLTVFEWQPTILIKSWPYHLLSIFLNVLEASPKDQMKLHQAFPEKQIIETAMTFTCHLEQNGISLVTPTEMLMYLMTAYLGPDSKFLEPDIKSLLKTKADYIRQCNASFNLDAKLESRKSFESLFSVFLDTFQSSSYGDEYFSALVMIPLSQKYDIKWRKRVWSEHIAVLRFITCTNDILFGGIDAYLCPDETDVSLLKCYHQAIGNNLLREGSVPYLIAKHHLNRFNDRRQMIKKN